MDQEGYKSTRDLLIATVDNDMAYARAFAAVAHSRYEQGRIDEANKARQHALRFCVKAHASVIRIAEEDRKLDLAELEKLRATLASLSRPLANPESTPNPEPGNSTDRPAKVARRWKFWGN